MSTDSLVEFTDFVSEAELVAGGCLACIDGRVQHGRIGAPGGDIGEFLLIAAAAEAELDVELSTTWIRRALLAIAEARGAVSMHTDVVSERRLYERLGRSYDEELSASDIASSPVAWTEPKTIGCGHVRSMMLHPKLYGVRRVLVQRTVQAFYELRATGAAMRLDVLQDVHREEAFVQVFGREVRGQQPSFALARAVEGRAFVEHPDARVVVRDSFIDVMESEQLFRGIGAVERVRRRIDSLELRHREATLVLLAPEVERRTVSGGWVMAAAE